MPQSVVTALTRNSVVRPIGYEELVIGAAAVGLTAALVANAWLIVIRLDDGGEIRFRVDGPDPTPTSGFPAFALDMIEFHQPEAQGFRAIRTAAPDMTARVLYYAIPT